MKFTSPFLAAILLALPATTLVAVAPAQANTFTPTAELPAGTYTLDKSHASLTWKVSHLGLSDYTARFTDFDATLELDPANPAKAKLTATVNPLSIETDYPNKAEKDFNKVLAEGAEWFNGGKFPTIQFKSKAIRLTGLATADIEGELTLLGVTKPLTLRATFNGGYANKPFAAPGTAAVGFSATATLRRSDWGLATYTPAIGDTVRLIIEAEFNKAAVATPKK